MEKKLAEYKCETNEAISLKLGMYIICFVSHCLSSKELC